MMITIYNNDYINNNILYTNLLFRLIISDKIYDKNFISLFLDVFF